MGLDKQEMYGERPGKARGRSRRMQGAPLEGDASLVPVEEA